MTLEEYVQRFRFSPISVHAPIREDVTGFLQDYPTLRLAVEKANSVFPPDERAVQSAIEEIALLPRLSTISVGLLINEIVSQMPADQAYVNVGVWCGFTLCAAFPGNHEKCCIGVDNFSQFGGPKNVFMEGFTTHKSGADHLFYEADYREYFQTHTMPIGFYFYDGEHSYENQLLGLETAEPFLAPGAIIMVDDTNWNEPREATLDFMRRHPGQYKIIADLKTTCDRHPTWWNGVMLLRKKA